LSADPPQRDRFYLIHMLECIGDIETYCRSAAIDTDQRTLDAVLRKLQILTESSMRISAELKAAHGEISWRELAGFRNVVVHDYLGIRIERIGPIISSDLPRLKEQLRAILDTPQERGDLRVELTAFVDEHQPGFVRCHLIDANGQRHEFVDKLPVFTDLDLEASSTFPQPGSIRCTVLGRLQDGSGRDLIRISTGQPDRVESTQGQTEFVVPRAQVSARTE